jgi:hypothetical protein
LRNDTAPFFGFRISEDSVYIGIQLMQSALPPRHLQNLLFICIEMQTLLYRTAEKALNKKQEYN